MGVVEDVAAKAPLVRAGVGDGTPSAIGEVGGGGRAEEGRDLGAAAAVPSGVPGWPGAGSQVMRPRQG